MTARRDGGGDVETRACFCWEKQRPCVASGWDEEEVEESGAVHLISPAPSPIGFHVSVQRKTLATPPSPSLIGGYNTPSPSPAPFPFGVSEHLARAVFSNGGANHHAQNHTGGTTTTTTTAAAVATATTPASTTNGHVSHANHKRKKKGEGEKDHKKPKRGEQTLEKPEGGFTFMQGTYYILKREHRFMTAKEIVAIAQQEGLFASSKGKTPEATVAAGIYVDLKKPNSLFIQGCTVGKRGFGLSEWKDVRSIPGPPAVPSKKKVKPNTKVNKLSKPKMDKPSASRKIHQETRQTKKTEDETDDEERVEEMVIIEEDEDDQYLYRTPSSPPRATAMSQTHQSG